MYHSIFRSENMANNVKHSADLHTLPKTCLIFLKMFKTSFLLFDTVKMFLCVVYNHTQSKTIKYLFRCSDVLLLSGNLEYASIQRDFRS